MNDKAFAKKVNRDIDKTKKDIATLGDDGVAGLSRIAEQLSDNAREKVAGSVKTFNEEVGQGLSQYNAKIQNIADRIPGDFSKQVTIYPWVTVTISVAFGLLLGLLIKPGRV